MTDLGRLVDPAELDREPGLRGRMDVEVPPAWLARGDTVAIVVPSRLVCARCDGGGCDGCARSGAVRVSGDEEARTVRLTLPRNGSARTRVRLVRPLGTDAELAQLVVDVKEALEPSAGCRLSVRPSQAQVLDARAFIAMAAVAMAAAAAIAAAMMMR